MLPMSRTAQIVEIARTFATLQGRALAHHPKSLNAVAVHQRALNTKIRALDFSWVSNISLDATAPVPLPSALELQPEAFIERIEKISWCDIVTIHDSWVVIQPVTFDPSLLVNPQYGPTELGAEDRVKIFGSDEEHLRRILGSISVASTAPQH
jgi:hypothetical protein